MQNHYSLAHFMLHMKKTVKTKGLADMFFEGAGIHMTSCQCAL